MMNIVKKLTNPLSIEYLDGANVRIRTVDLLITSQNLQVF